MAKDEIVRTFWLQTMGDRYLSPYCFILGAGISDPLVPVASKLVLQFREEISRARLEQPPETLSQTDGYYQCFDRAYPNPQSRRNFLRRIIEGKPPSNANLQAAQLLGPQGLARLAITTNFDRMLPEALQLLGHEFISLDHPKTIVSRFDPKAQTIQVLQIHGTYEHYDFCNLQEEILDRAGALRSLLYALFLQWCPIVVGYSGWEDDAIMTALKLRLAEARGSMSAGLYWMCYTQADADDLPNWLKDDPSVRIVVASSDTTQPSKLPAEEVFTTLLAGLEEFRAAVVPSRHVAAPVATSLAAFAAAEQSLAQGEYENAFEELRPLDLARLTEGERAHCGKVLQQVYQDACRTKPETALAACLFWQSVAELPGAMSAIEQRRMLAHAIYGQGPSLLTLGRRAEAMERLDEVQKLCRSTAEDCLLAERAAHAGNAQAVALYREGRKEEAFDQWRGLVLGPGAERMSEEAIVFALFNLWHASELTGQVNARIYWNALRDHVAVGEAGHVHALRLWNEALGTEPVEFLAPDLGEHRPSEDIRSRAQIVGAQRSATGHILISTAANRIEGLLAALAKSRDVDQGSAYDPFLRHELSVADDAQLELELANGDKSAALHKWLGLEAGDRAAAIEILTAAIARVREADLVDGVLLVNWPEPEAQRNFAQYPSDLPASAKLEPDGNKRVDIGARHGGGVAAGDRKAVVRLPATANRQVRDADSFAQQLELELANGGKPEAARPSDGATLAERQTAGDRATAIELLAADIVQVLDALAQEPSTGSQHSFAPPRDLGNIQVAKRRGDGEVLAGDDSAAGERAELLPIDIVQMRDANCGADAATLKEGLFNLDERRNQNVYWHSCHNEASSADLLLALRAAVTARPPSSAAPADLAGAAADRHQTDAHRSATPVVYTSGSSGIDKIQLDNDTNANVRPHASDSGHLAYPIYTSVTTLSAFRNLMGASDRNKLQTPATALPFRRASRSMVPQELRRSRRPTSQTTKALQAAQAA